MVRPKTAFAGFNPRVLPVASSCLSNAVAASLMLAAVSLCLCVGLTLMTAGASVAMPLAQ